MKPSLRTLKGLDIIDCIDHKKFIKDLLNNNLKDKIEQIFHLGACSKTTEPDRDYIMDVNLDYSKKILKCCANNNINLIYASSASVYGSGGVFKEEPANESSLNHYSESKLLFDNFVRENLENITSQVAGMRYFNVYGPHEEHKEVMSSVVYHFFNQIKKTKRIKLFKGSHGYNDGEQRRDFVYVKDTVDIKLWFMENKISGIYNVATGKSRSFNDIAKAVISYYKLGSIDYIDFPEGLLDQYQAFTEADMSNLKRCGYTNTPTELEDGVSSYLDYLENHRYDKA